VTTLLTLLSVAERGICTQRDVEEGLRIGLNHNAPNYIVGVGYTFRLDGLFASNPR